MFTMMLALLLQGAGDKGLVQFSQFWPTTAVGWITLLLSVLGLLGLLYGSAKALTAINGLGGRVDKVEKDQQAAKGREDERDRVWAARVQNMRDLTRQISEAKHTAERCDTNAEQYFIQIGSKLNELGQKMDSADRTSHGRLSAIETELRIRNQAIPLYVDKK